MLRVPLLVRSRPGLAARRLASTQPPRKIVIPRAADHPVKNHPEWECVGSHLYRGAELIYMRKNDPRNPKVKARKKFRWLLKMNAVLLGCIFLLEYVGRRLEKERKQPEENEKQAEKERARRERENKFFGWDDMQFPTAEPPGDAIDATRPR